MGVLADSFLRRLLAEGQLILSDSEGSENSFSEYTLEDWQIQPASIDLTIGGVFLINKPPPSGIVRLGKSLETEAVRISPFLLKPDGFALGTTREIFRIPDNILCIVCGVSSNGRLGLEVEIAGLVDPGFEGRITLELKNNSPDYTIEIHEGDKIAQAYFLQMNGKVIRPYRGKYQGQMNTTAALEHIIPQTN